MRFPEDAAEGVDVEAGIRACFQIENDFGTCFRKLCRKMKTIDEFLQELINEQLEQGILSGNQRRRTF